MWQQRVLLAITLTATVATVSAADQVTLTSGETLTGKIIEQTDQAVTLDHPILGRLTIAADNITATKVQPAPNQTESDASDAPASDQPATSPPADAQSSDQSAEPAEPAEPAESGEPGEVAVEPDDKPSFLDNWDAQLKLSFSGTDGNSETANFRLGFDANKDDDLYRWILKSSYYFSSSDGNTSRKQINADLMKEWLLPDSDWFVFVQGIYDYDEFKAWDHRASGFTGLGYDFVKFERLQVRSRVGGGLTKEFGGEDELRPEGLISAGLIKWQITDAQSLTGEVTLYPDLAEFDEYRTTTKIEWQIKIDQADGLRVNLGIENEYESRTEGDSKHNDLKYYGGLVIDF